MEYKEMHCISKGLVYITTNLMNFIYNRYILCYDNFEMYDVSDDKNGVLSYLFVFDARKVKKYKLILRVESDSCYMSLPPDWRYHSCGRWQSASYRPDPPYHIPSSSSVWKPSP